MQTSSLTDVTSLNKLRKARQAEIASFTAAALKPSQIAEHSSLLHLLQTSNSVLVAPTVPTLVVPMLTGVPLGSGHCARLLLNVGPRTRLRLLVGGDSLL